MRPNRWLALLSGLLPLLGARAEEWRPLPLLDAEERVLHSRHTGRDYRIFLSRPQGEPPPGGYPVVYTLDGNLLFPMLAQQARMYSPLSSRAGREALLVVGIGYPGDAPFDVAARAEDYTPPAADLHDTGDQFSDRHGGAERFLAFIEDELKPLIAARHPLDHTRQTLFGHSYGGLFTVYTLLTRPQAFQRYYASSPSLWWNHAYVFGLLPEQAPPAPIALVLSVGSGEQPSHAAQDARERHLAERRIVDNAERLGRRLEALGVPLEVRVHAAGDHASNAFTSAVQVLDFALQ